jgi:hypothetical protein
LFNTSGDDITDTLDLVRKKNEPTRIRSRRERTAAESFAFGADRGPGKLVAGSLVGRKR